MKLRRREIRHRLSSEDIMAEHDRLTSLILQRWTEMVPSMVEQLRQQNLLEEELESTAEAFTDLMYERMWVQKMDYVEAWNSASELYLSATPVSILTNPAKEVPEIFASRKPTPSGWAGRMRRSKET